MSGLILAKGFSASDDAQPPTYTSPLLAGEENIFNVLRLNIPAPVSREGEGFFAHN